MRFRLTIRNVNFKKYGLGLSSENSFRLTIRNVNIDEIVVQQFSISSFRLTIRNVNSKENERTEKFCKVLD